MSTYSPGVRKSYSYEYDTIFLTTGCSIAVVFAHGVGKARVRLPAARKDNAGLV